MDENGGNLVLKGMMMMTIRRKFWEEGRKIDATFLSPL